MWRQSNVPVAQVIGVLVRWRRSGAAAFALLFALGTLAALLRPMRYEAQVILERKPIRVTPVIGRVEDERFDVYRLTSESQWSVALLKSRFLMDRWLEAVDPRPRTPEEQETGVRRLARSLKVQPISYTDLFMVKVRARSPEEAQRRAALLVETFAGWDQEQNNRNAEALVKLLNERIRQVARDLGDQWARLKGLKTRQSLSLSGSSSARQLELDIGAKGKLYDMLTTELEEAERQLNTDRLPRTRALAPPSMPGAPVMPRGRLLMLAFFLSLIGALAWVFLLEWIVPPVPGETGEASESQPAWVNHENRSSSFLLRRFF